MNKPVKIGKDIYWVGVIDWNIRNFHGHTYSTLRGTTYNAYLILDDKVTLVDTVMGSFSKGLIDNIAQLIAPEKIDYIISNHVETDHSGALPEILKLNPKAKVYCSAKGKEGLFKHYYGNWDFQVVKTNDKLKLGKKTLSFIETPMIHWPDSMFTYLAEDQILLPNDAFGQHYATSERFDDEVDECALMDEAAKYYANILIPLSPIILKKIQELVKMNLPIKMIAPSHGIIWRRDPGKIINAYTSWAKNETKSKVIVVYETMWQSTEKMARKITEGLTDAGISVKLFDIAQTDRTEVIKELLDAKGICLGSSTHDNDMLANIASFLELLKGLKPKNRVAGAFGSYGWAGGALKEIENAVGASGIKLVQPSLGVKYVPDDKELEACYNWGKDFAKNI
ncbi:MAG: flavodoxin domain-containing protein [Candidatus Omnitrophica bacterium]|nr:flavodoxin domain-containing protein [Candidatus Omnitrophota bacterium]